MRKSASGLVLAVVFGGYALGAQEMRQKESVDYVSPNIGGIGQLLTATIPYVQWPHGMARLAPVTTPGIMDRYLADKVYGFPAGTATLMVSTGAVSTHPESYASDLDHDFETATPYYYAATLPTSGVKAEYTASKQAAYYRFTIPAGPHAQLVLSMEKGSQLKVDGDSAVEGGETITGPVGDIGEVTAETREYFYAIFRKPLGTYQTWKGEQLSHASQQAGDHLGFVEELPPSGESQVEVKVGISYISAEQARRNVEREMPGWAFDDVKSAARTEWNRALDGVKTTGGTEQQRTIFYTALYRSLGRMTDITEDGKYFSGYDHAVHEAQGHDFYIDDGLWDTYRSLHPLQILLDGKQQEDMIRSYLRMYEQSGWLPSFPSVAGEQAVMIGHHAASFIVDAYMKGNRDFDVNEAYAAIRKNATQATMLPWKRGSLTALDHVYFDKGFFPALANGEAETVPEVTGEKRQAVSVTLETSYDDWCVAQLAKALGKQDDYRYFSKLARNYTNMFNTEIGFMAPKSADGQWVADFDPKLGGGQGGRDYFTEVDSWLYTFHVQHDVAGLVELLGGRDAFNAKLDQLFAEQYGTSKFRFLNQFPDATGLVGLYAQGNEPSFHIPYLYDFSGQPWKAQRRVRQLMDVWYSDGPLGIPGDEDGGETSSWYVLSALGFYPVCPGSPVYEIGSPIFAKSSIRMAGGKDFTIVANHVSAQNKYIQSAQLNGKVWTKAWFRHADIANGGTLRLEMGDKPNLEWGADVSDAPPSMTQGPGGAQGSD